MSQQPVPVQPLSYSTPLVYGRPGIITAIGIVSIVLGSMGIMFHGLGTLYGFVFVVAAQLTPGATATGTVVEDDDAAPTLSSRQGLDEQQRIVILDGLGRHRELSAVRRAHVDALMARHGRNVIWLTGDSLTPEAVAANVSRSGGAGGEADADFFVLGLGRLEVSDEEAVFTPSDGRAPMRVAAGAGGDADSDTLTDEQVDALIERAQSLSGDRLSEAQLAAFRNLIEAPQQQYIMPDSGVQAVTAQLHGVHVDPDGAASFNLAGGYIQIGPRGSVSSAMTWGGGGMVGMGGFPLSSAAAALALAGSAGHLALGILLLVAGIMVLRQSRLGRRLHVIYAWIKMPLAVVTSIGWVWVWYSFMQGLAQGLATMGGAGAAAPAAGLSWESIVVIGTATLLGIAYPVALLITFRTRAVREYYNSVVG